jgi:hypothetical protein
LTDRQKIHDLEIKVSSIIEQQQLILLKMEMLINIFKNPHEHNICTCGGNMTKIESKYPNTSVYWECLNCGNTFIPTE